MIRIAALSLVFAAACGGSQTPDTSEPGDTHTDDQAGDLDVDKNNGEDPGTTDPDEGNGSRPAPRDPYTIVLKNTADTELVFNMDNGWAANIVMYSGKPPKAVLILPFAKHCTASCDTDDGDRCPVCPKPERLQDIKKAQKLERVAAGDSLEVPWDGQVHVYEKVKRKCECYALAPAPEGEYSVKACGLRLTKSAKSSTKIQCIEGKLTVPSEGPQQIEFEFPSL